jgi:hypothetical protein
MQVFVDPSGASADEALAAEDTVATPWNELGTRKERIKENVPKVSKLRGTTLSQPGRQQRVTSAPAVSMSSRISVFRDPTPGEGDPMPPPLAAPDAKVRGKEREVPKTPGCSSIIPFKDEVKEAPSTPRFVPFKDDVVSVCNTTLKKIAFSKVVSAKDAICLVWRPSARERDESEDNRDEGRSNILRSGSSEKRSVQELSRQTTGD